MVNGVRGGRYFLVGLCVTLESESWHMTKLDSRTICKSLAIALFFAAFAIVVYPLAMAHFRSMRRVTNHPLSLPLEVDLGEIEGTTHFDLEVMNVGEVSVTIVGAMSGCDCLVPSNVPLTIEPNDKKFLEFDFDPKRVDDSGTTRLALKLQLLTTTATALPAITVFATFVHNSSVDSELIPIPME